MEDMVRSKQGHTVCRILSDVNGQFRFFSFWRVLAQVLFLIMFRLELLS
jgi:hypothetical protein